MVRVNSRKPGNPFAGHTGNEKILVAGRRCLADKVLQVKAAAGTFRMLAYEVQYFHSKG